MRSEELEGAAAPLRSVAGFYNKPWPQTHLRTATVTVNLWPVGILRFKAGLQVLSPYWHQRHHQHYRHHRLDYR
jgi:hypothetical protein